MSVITIGTSVIAGEPIQTANGRDIHKELEVKKDFSDWVKAQIKRADLTENQDFVALPQKGVGGKFDSIEYHFTLEAGKHIAMLSGTAKGKQIRKYFIECEAKAQSKAPAVVHDPVLAAHIATLMRLDVVQQEQKRQDIAIAQLQEHVALVDARTQPNLEHYTVVGYCRLIKRPVDLATASRIGRKCSQLSKERGMHIGKAHSEGFGEVGSYHVSVLRDVISELETI